jgi:hypothetical protein
VVALHSEPAADVSVKYCVKFGAAKAAPRYFLSAAAMAEERVERRLTAILAADLYRGTRAQL